MSKQSYIQKLNGNILIDLTSPGLDISGNLPARGWGRLRLVCELSGRIMSIK